MCASGEETKLHLGVRERSESDTSYAQPQFWLIATEAHFILKTSLYFYLTVINNMIIFYIVRGCPGFDGIGKSRTAGRAEGPLNWQTNNCNFRKKRRRSWWGFFRSRSTRCVSSRAGIQVALFRVAWHSFTLSGLAVHCVWSLHGTFNQNTEATLVMLLPAPDNYLA